MFLEISNLRKSFGTYTAVQHFDMKIDRGEFTMASLLNRPAFGPYLQNIGANRAYEPAALAVLAFAVTWACMGLINVFGRGPSDMAAPEKR